jgi:cysteine desulfurase
MSIYLDNAASTPLLEETAEFYTAQLKALFGNPHADTAYSHECRTAIAKAERQVKDSVKAPKETKVIWTSGGTECNNLLLQGLDWQAGDEVITSDIEHPAIVNPLKLAEAQGVIIHTLKIDSTGNINLDDLRNRLNPKTKLVSIISLHNELGVINDLQAIRTVLNEQKSKALFHTDNVQGFGKIHLNWQACGLDFMSTAGHKFHAPNSCGALICNPSIKLRPLLYGGGQQEGLRSGTQDPAVISAYGFATELNNRQKDEQLINITKLNQLCRKGLTTLTNNKNKKIDIIYHSQEHNSPYILMFSIKGYEGAVIMRFLSTMGTYIGVGSACSAESKEPNKTLAKMGVPRDIAFGALRVSFGWQTSEKEVLEFLRQLQKVIVEY